MIPAKLELNARKTRNDVNLDVRHVHDEEDKSIAIHMFQPNIDRFHELRLTPREAAFLVSDLNHFVHNPQGVSPGSPHGSVSATRRRRSKQSLLPASSKSPESDPPTP